MSMPARSRSRCGGSPRPRSTSISANCTTSAPNSRCRRCWLAARRTSRPSPIHRRTTARTARTSPTGAPRWPSPGGSRRRAPNSREPIRTPAASRPMRRPPSFARISPAWPIRSTPTTALRSSNSGSGRWCGPSRCSAFTSRPSICARAPIVTRRRSPNSCGSPASSRPMRRSTRWRSASCSCDCSARRGRCVSLSRPIPTGRRASSACSRRHAGCAWPSGRRRSATTSSAIRRRSATCSKCSCCRRSSASCTGRSASSARPSN